MRWEIRKLRLLRVVARAPATTVAVTATTAAQETTAAVRVLAVVEIVVRTLGR